MKSGVILLLIFLCCSMLISYNNQKRNIKSKGSNIPVCSVVEE